jgi:hypothetical protein
MRPRGGVLTTKKTPENEEETLRKSLILVLLIVGGGASYAASITELGTDPAVTDPSTWRWQVSSILADQDKSAAPSTATFGALDTDAFDQHYERYSPLGLPEPRRPNSQ